jgi:hypothetical protein
VRVPARSSTELPPAFAPTRATLHRVAAHVLGRRRHDATGRFGLRASPGGLSTPAFGDGPETLRITGGTLVREAGGKCAYRTVAGSTIRELAAFAGTDVEPPFSAGADTPPAGDVDAPLEMDTDAARVLADWYQLGWRVLDEVVASLPVTAEPDVIQLWPEHFDVGTNVGTSNGTRVNLGASPGDALFGEPYLYLGPWGNDRPGDAAYWNAPFGSVLGWSAIGDGPRGVDAGVRFLCTGLQYLSGQRD